MLKKYSKTMLSLFAISDVVWTLCAFSLSYWIRFNLFEAPRGVPDFNEYINPYIFIIISLVWLSIFSFSGLYQPRRGKSKIDEFKTLSEDPIMEDEKSKLDDNLESWQLRIMQIYDKREEEKKAQEEAEAKAKEEQELLEKQKQEHLEKLENLTNEINQLIEDEDINAAKEKIDEFKTLKDDPLQKMRKSHVVINLNHGNSVLCNCSINRRKSVKKN